MVVAVATGTEWVPNWLETVHPRARLGVGFADRAAEPLLIDRRADDRPALSTAVSVAGSPDKRARCRRRVASPRIEIQAHGRRLDRQGLNLVTRVSYPPNASISSRTSGNLDDMDDLDVAADVATDTRLGTTRAHVDRASDGRRH